MCCFVWITCTNSMYQHINWTYFVVAGWAKNYGKFLHALERPLVVPFINWTKLTALCSDSLKWMHFALHSHLFFWERERGRENKLGNACLPGQPTASTYSFFCKDLLITWMDLMIKPVRSSLPYPNCTVTDRLFVLFKKNMKWSIFMDSSDRLIFIFIWVSCCWPSVWIHLEFS